jgi:response regulator of citrate/malate metabolism
MVGFHCDNARKSDERDHPNWDFFRRRLRVQKLFGVVGYEKEIMDAPSVSQQRVTDLLTRWSSGDDAALAELTPLVYEELRRLAHRQMGAERYDEMAEVLKVSRVTVKRDWKVAKAWLYTQLQNVDWNKLDCWLLS